MIHHSYEMLVCLIGRFFPSQIRYNHILLPELIYQVFASVFMRRRSAPPSHGSPRAQDNTTE